MPSTSAQRNSAESAIICELASQETAAPSSSDPPRPLRTVTVGNVSTLGGDEARVGQASPEIFRKASFDETATSNPDCPSVPAVSWKGGAKASPSVLARRWKRACALTSAG